MTWIHSCVAVDSTLNHLTVVVNGKKLEDKAFPIPAGEQPPSDLTGKLAIFKGSIGLWYQSKDKMSNLNIFSKQLTLPEMVSRTAGDDCGKADGDYLDWESAEWVLEGKASLGEVSVEDLCRKESNIQLFTAPVSDIGQCMDLCVKIQKGAMAAMGSPEESQKFFSRVDEVLSPGGESTQAGVISPAAWAPIRQTSNGSWNDLFTKKQRKMQGKLARKQVDL